MTRVSNIELLRIVAMMMIVVHHVITHGIAPTILGGKMPVALSLIDSFVIYGVNLFVLISGYFLIRLSWKSYLGLMWIIAFYKIFHLCADTWILGISHPFYEWLLKPLSGPVSGGGWFVDVYVLLMLVSPMLNKLLSSMQRREYFAGLCVLLVLDVGYSNILKMHFDAYGYDLLHFITLYFMGYGILRFRKPSKRRAICVLLGLQIAICLLLVLPIFGSQCFSSYNNPLVMFASCCIFVLFAKTEMGTNKIVNFVAASMFPVYLIHDGGNIGRAFYSLIGNWWIGNDWPTFLGLIIMLIIALFVTAIVIDQLRVRLAPYVVKPLVVFCQEMTGKFFKGK